MAKLHHATLKSAVGKYKHLAKEGQNDGYIKSEIAKDPKSFSAEEVNEIFEAISAGDSSDTYVVVKEFRDINDFTKVISEGEDVSHFDKGRLAKLVEIGHVEKQ